MIRTVNLLVAILCLQCVAAPIASNTGARHLQYAASSEDEKFYILDGAVGLWDGIWNVGWGMHDETATQWENLLANTPIPACAFGENYSVPTGNSWTDGRLSTFRITGDFTLHARLITVSTYNWYNWTMIGIGTAAGMENGICFSARNTSNGGGSVCYRKAYSGAIITSVPTGVGTDELCSLDVVFQYETKTYLVYVNGIYVGEATIQEEDWNLDGKNLNIGTIFYSLDHIGMFRRFCIIYYNRALSEDEIAYNYSIDEARFGL